VDPLAVYNPVMETEFYGDGEHNGGVYYWGNLNPYIYTYQNPIKYIDPNGKQTLAIKGTSVIMNENFTTLKSSQNMSSVVRNDIIARGYIANAALNQQVEKNTTHIYSHGYYFDKAKSRTYLSIYNKKDNEFQKIYNEDQLKTALKSDNISTDFLDTKGGNLILHGCFAGYGEGSVADILSRENPDKTVVGATGNVFYNEKEEIGTWDKHSGQKGKWNVFKNGKIIKSFNWNWKPNAKDLNNLKKK